ncbi:MAG: hypothetical protein ISS63_16670 [Desulfobacteraceae bacterium]|nr:hypothetical protein [Desulfobacteraceae bacterium]
MKTNLRINSPSPGGLRLVEPTPRRGGDEGEGKFTYLAQDDAISVKGV